MAEKKGLEQKNIQDRIEYAKGLYSKAVKYMEDVEDLFTGDYLIEDEAEDVKITKVIPSRPRAILTKTLAMLAVRAELNLEVVPLKVAKKEQEACSILERWLDGYQYQVQYGAKKPLYRDWVFWFCLRGRGDLELRYYPELADDPEQLAIKTVVDDPMTIFPVWGREGIGYYAKIYKVPAWELMEGFSKAYEGWNIPDLSEKKIDDEVEVKEYWDKDNHAAIVDEKLVYSKPNPFGFVPLAEAQAERTPLAAMEWASQGILYPIMNALKQQAQLMCKVATATEMFYWPEFLARTADGQLVKIETGPGSPRQLPTNCTELIQVKPTPNQALVETLNAWLQGDINLYSIPEIAWGIEPSNLQSGFAISQVLGQVMDRIQDKKENLEMAAGWHFGDLLRAIEKFGTEGNASFSVVVRPEKQGQRKSALEISAKDVEGHYRVDCKITPQLPSDKMQNMKLAQVARQPGVDGSPLLPDSYLRREIISVEQPDEVEEELEAQMMEVTAPEIQAWKRQKYIETWRKEHGIQDQEWGELQQVAQDLVAQMAMAGGGQQPTGIPSELLPSEMQGGYEQGYPGLPEPSEEERQWL